ncbi:unknown [Methanothermobacter thermautotrophicus str. Delta H]|uniref:Uncharacterized protein n=1 Tax=Methanothermobacter thermautotrophicus (strain ATCC 29096 / DSM 1053 / JCM 10044 / NBRC 100330 / Delta H) TaxID=187420 RepID=O27921_METTH|nr:unknown [Methanothermobacter thermautotrophicus str. Delta H]
MYSAAPCPASSFKNFILYTSINIHQFWLATLICVYPLINLADNTLVILLCSHQYQHI